MTVRRPLVTVSGITKELPSGDVIDCNYDPTQPVVFHDDFLYLSNETGEVGSLGWSYTNGSVASIAGEANHPGIFRRTSGAVTNEVSSFYPNGSGSTVTMLFGSLDEMTWVFRPITSGTDFTLRFGIGSGPTGTTMPNGVYLERLAADTSYFGVARSSNTETRTSALKTITANEWTKVRIRRITSSSVGFSIDGGSETTISSNVPGATGGQIIFSHIIPTTNNAREVDIDWFSLRTNALTR